MLRSLHIENVAVIRRTDIEFDQGFCVLTGETGAGKSILVDSINLLLGGRFSKELIRTGEDSAMISALFEEITPATHQELGELGVHVSEEDAGALMLQRTVTRDGRSSARINGRAVPLSVLKEVGALLVNIHGQNDHQKLMQKTSHGTLLDAFARHEEELVTYRDLYARWKDAEDARARLDRDESERLRLREMLAYQVQDIDGVKLKAGEEENLTAERDRLQHHEEVEKRIRLACRALRDSEKSNVYNLCDRAEEAVEGLCRLMPECEPLLERIRNIKYEADDIADTLRDMSEDEGDPTARLDRIEGRLEDISRLKRKYGSDVSEVLAFRDRAAAELEELDTADERMAEYEKASAEWAARLAEQGKRLTDSRRRAAVELSRQVAEALTFLDMPRVHFEVAVRPLGHHGPDGADDVEFMIATNVGEPLQSMVHIASGGELSRIVLALRSVLNQKYGVETAIYDEVDTGVSGRTSRKVGIKLCRMADRSGGQVICVTHSAQIASLADAHYRIEKSERDGRAETSVARLTETERVEEIARILGGLSVTDAQRAAAVELIRERDTVADA
jgi:DNA repair protein RecN (Recombination protein N)